MTMGRALMAVLVAMSWSSCSCRTTAIKSNVGELVIVIPQADGELLTREAQIAVPDVAMDDVGVTSVKLRNVGNAPLTIATVTREPGGEVFDLDLPDGTVLEANAELDVTVRFAPPQAADATLLSVAWAGTFRFDLIGVAPDEALASLDLRGQALARDCYVPAAVDFGEVVPGQRVSVPFTLTNGKRAASLTTFGAVTGSDPTVFQVGATEPVSVPPGASTQVPLWFAPKAELEYHATLEVQRGPQCAKVNVALTGRGSATALTWTPARLDFGRMPLSYTSAPQTVVVTNRSRAPLSVSAASVGSNFTLTSPNSVPGGGTATFSVSCRPQVLGPLTEALTFVLGTDPATIVTVPLTCIGGGPRIKVSPTALNFASIPVVRTGEVVAIRRLTVQNVGTPPATPGDTSNNLVLGDRGHLPLVSVLPLSGGTTSAEFEVTVPSNYPAGGLPAVAGSNSVDLEVRFAPKTLGAKSAELRIYSNDNVTPVTKVVLTANAFQGEFCSSVVVKPAALSFGDSQAGATLERTITVENSGPTPCQVFGADMVAGSDPAFSVLDQSLITIAPGGQATLRVRAIVPKTAVQGDLLRGAVRLSLPGGVFKVVPVELKVATCLVVAPTVLDFGTTGVNCRSETLAVTLYNACALPITLEALAVTAPFRITSGPPITAGGVELIAGEPQIISLVFVPSQVASLSGALTVTVVEGGTQRVVTVPLSGEGAIDSHHQEAWTQGKGDVDILFVIDDSCSMADEQVALGTNFQSFIQHALSTGANFQLGVTTTDVFAINGALLGSPSFLTPATPSLLQTFQQRALVGIGGNGQEEPLEALLRAMTPPKSTSVNAGFFRTGVPLAAVIVSDAVDQSPLAVSVYLSKLRAAKNNRADLVNVSVVGPFTQPSATCLLDSTIDDGRYAELLAATHGAKGDICTTDWAKDLDAIGSSVLGLNSRFPLTSIPGPGSSVEVTVNGTALPLTAFQVDPVTRQVVLNAPPATGATVTAKFDTACYAP
jgi:hypothetical protein